MAYRNKIEEKVEFPNISATAQNKGSKNHFVVISLLRKQLQRDKLQPVAHWKIFEVKVFFFRHEAPADFTSYRHPTVITRPILCPAFPPGSKIWTGCPISKALRWY